MLKGWLTRLSTPPRLSASGKPAQLADDALGVTFIALHHHRNHAARQGDLLARQLMTGAKPARETRLAPLPAAVPAIRRAARSRCGAPSAAPGYGCRQRQEAAERVKHAAYRILQMASFSASPELSPTTARPATTSEWPLSTWSRVHHISNPCSSGRWIAGEAKVYGDADQVMAARDGGDGAEIRELQQRVSGRFHPDHAGVGRIAASIPARSSGFTQLTCRPALRRRTFSTGGKCRHHIDRHQVTVISAAPARWRWQPARGENA